MTAQKTATTTLAEALAAVQADLPEVRKAETAKVPTKTGGSYSYTYADLAAITRVILPRLGQVGLSWTTKPTIVGDRFVLVYKLLHSSGEFEEGAYPLPDRGSPQEIGSAITYARRYALCSVTGVAPDDDDDAAEATAGHRRNQEMASRPRDDAWESARPARTANLAVVSALATELAAQVRTSATKDDLTAAWRALAAAKASGQISADEADQIAKVWNTRKAEVLPAEAKTPANDPARRRMYDLLTKAELAKDRDAKLAYVSDVVGREVGSTNDLTDDEVRAVCERLESYVRQLEPAGAPA